MLIRKLCGIVLAALLALSPAWGSAEQVFPRLGRNGGAAAAAFGENFLFFDPAEPTRLYVIDAGTGNLTGYCLLGDSSGGEQGLWIRITGEYALIQTPSYAYRMNRSLRIEARVPIPELPGVYSVSEDLSRVVYQNLIHIEQMDLESGEVTRLLEGDYDAFPQEIYSSPVYLSGEEGLLVYENVGAEDPVPAVYGFEEDELVPSGLTFDLDSACKPCGDLLLVCGALLQTEDLPFPDSSPVQTAPDSVFSAERVSGVFNPAERTFIPLPLPLTGYGVQAMAVNSAFAFFFGDSPDGWTLYKVSLKTGESSKTGVLCPASSNLELLAVTEGGRVLYRSFDFGPSGGTGGYFVA